VNESGAEAEILCELTRHDWIMPRPCSQKAVRILEVKVGDRVQNVCVCRDCFMNILEEIHVHSVSEAESVRLRAD
jgi:hypothetical protein